MLSPFHRKTKRMVPPVPQPKPEPAIFVIFGITGDLAQHMLLPALYHLIKDGLLHEHTEIVGISRRHITRDELLGKVKLCVIEKDNVCDPAVVARLRKNLTMLQLDAVNSSDYDTLHARLQAIEDKHGVCMNRLFYLAIPSQVYQPVIEQLGSHGLNSGCKHHRGVSRLLVEKPFGYDLASARELVQETARYFSERQVFRIDHYLAKEMAQNILVFRAQNPLFTSVWDRRHVRAIDLKFNEQIGIEGRVGFYDSTGALRDVIQNHLLQLLTLATMELPKSITNEAAVHASKRALLRAIPAINVRTYPPVRGQYDTYQQEVRNPGSMTETFAHLQLEINSSRWRGVPVTLTAGKALARKQTLVQLTFSDKGNTENHNRLTFYISPDEGIDIELTAKRPGFDEKTETVSMAFGYPSAFGDSSHPDAYERVLLDAVRGDHALFASSDEVLEAWRILQPVLDAWAMSDTPPLPYAKGSDGPV